MLWMAGQQGLLITFVALHHAHGTGRAPREDNVVVFRVDPQSGRLTPKGVNVQVPTPVSVTFVAE